MLFDEMTQKIDERLDTDITAVLIMREKSQQNHQTKSQTSRLAFITPARVKIPHL